MFAISLLGGFDWIEHATIAEGDLTALGGSGGIGIGYQLGDLLRFDVEVLGGTATGTGGSGQELALTRVHVRPVAQLMLAASNAPVGMRIGVGGDFGKLFASDGIRESELLGVFGRFGVNVAVAEPLDLALDLNAGTTKPFGFTGSVMLRIEWRIPVTTRSGRTGTEGPEPAR